MPVRAILGGYGTCTRRTRDSRKQAGSRCETNVQDLARRLGITATTLYMYVNGDGTVKAPGQKLLDAAST